VSEFPNPADVAPPPPAEQRPPRLPSPPCAPDQYAGDFERLRDRAAAHEDSTGSAPSVFLATLGPLAEHTARTAFTTNLFATGGITAVDRRHGDRRDGR
jgi:methylmalonyl-CoA mutase